MSAKPPLRLLTIGHSYVVALNRRLPQEIARVAGDRWSVTAVAPRFVRAELRDIALEPDPSESSNLEPINAYATNHLHVMTFGLRLRQILRQRWDFVHIYQEPYIFAGWQSAYWTPRGIPYVFYTAQNIPKNYPPPFSWMERYTLNRCAGWIGCGETIVEAQLRRGYGSKPHRVIGFGVDTDMFRPDAERGARARHVLGWDNSIPVVCFLGRFAIGKGLELLMAALDRLHCPWRALFIGSGPLQRDVEEWGKKYPERVRICGATHDQVPPYLNAADILCAPSQTLPSVREQFGRMLIEGFASGVALVGSDSGEVPHVIGDAGLVVGERDRDGWVKALTSLLENKNLRDDLSLRGRRRAIEQFSWSVIARQHLDFFEEVIARRAAS
jgi:glycosyltransferase involved in cell wall biosynthesis